MDITIIIPVYNRAEIVQATLDSVAEQSFRPINLILVDNNSTDNSLQVLEQFKANHQAHDFHITVLQESTPGAPAARNCGLQAATTEWIMFFDSDDFMDPDLLQSYAQLADDHTDVVVTKARQKWLNGSTSLLPYFEKDIFANHLIHASLATQRFIARRAVFEKAGLWNVNLMAWNDWELGVRILLTSPRIAFMGDKTRVQINFTEASITGLDFCHKHGVWEQAIDAVEHYIRESEHPDKGRLLNIVNYRRVVLAAHYQREGHPEFATPLYHLAMQRSEYSRFNSAMLYLAFHYISRGGRGFGRLIRRFF